MDADDDANPKRRKKSNTHLMHEHGLRKSFLRRSCLLLFWQSLPSVDKDTQGFRSQTARHNCVVLI